MFSEVPPFAMDRPRHDMETYSGRLAHFYNAIDPRLLLENEKSLERHQFLLQTFQQKSREVMPAKVTDADLWASKKAVDSCVHPVTGHVIPPMFRMAAFIPLNLFIVPYMLMPSTIASVPRTVFIHWFNQSLNCAVNYANRGSDAQPMSSILTAYGAAVTVSVAGALTATYAMKKLPKGSPLTTVVRAILPACAVAFSGSANLAIMRKNEWAGDGLQVKDEDGKVVGNSVEAGRVSLSKCVLARILWNIPPMVLPPLIGSRLMHSFPFLQQHSILTESSLCVMGSTLGVPAALAVFPPVETISASKIESRFQSLKRENGEPVRTLTYVKGM